MLHGEKEVGGTRGGEVSLLIDYVTAIDITDGKSSEVAWMKFRNKTR